MTESGGPVDDRTTGASPHELLLALAGRIDDDLLAWCRELVAVGEDGHALELLTATLIADRTALPAPARAAVVAAARTARTDLDADAALAPADTEYGTAHRFDAGPAADAVAAAVGALPARQVAGCRTWVTARVTPAGTAPGPLPQPVVLVEVGADDVRPVDVLAYQIAIACERAGTPAAVEVVVAGAVRPEYQQAALRGARPVHGPGEDAAKPPSGSAAAPASVEADVFAIPDVRPAPEVAEEPPTPEPPAAQPEDPLWPATGSLVLPPAPEPTPSETTVPEPAVPAPPPRRSFAPLRSRTVTPLPRPAGQPSPVPLARRTPRPLAPVGDDGTASPVRALPVPAPGSGAPALASLGDPLSAPVEPEQPPPGDVGIDERDPLGIGQLPLPDEEREPATPDADSWLADWISGDWAMSRSALDPADPLAAGPAPSPVAEDPAPDPAEPALAEPAPPDQPPRPAPQVRPRVEIDRVDPPPPRRRPPPAARQASTASPESALEQTGFILRPESVARLSDADRELLARLQSEIGETPRPRVTRRAGIAGNGPGGNGESPAGANGRQRGAPPDA